MSFRRKFLAGWAFRTTTPELSPGETVHVFVSEYDPATGEGIAFVGDTELHVTGFDPEHVDQKVAVDVTEYDPETNVARGEFSGVVGESSYTG